MGIQNHLGSIRQSRGISAADLAKSVGVSRQTIYAIEAGTYVPNTAVALKLARRLEVPVEGLFALPAEAQGVPEALPSELLSASPCFAGQAVRIGMAGERLVSIPVNASPYFLPESDGVISSVGRSRGKAGLVVVSGAETFHKRLVLAGCDPAIGLLAGMLEKQGGIEIIPAAASSKLALKWLKEGKVHVAGSHLRDGKTGEFNLPYIRSEFPDGDYAVITFARWEEGFVSAAGNPKQIRSVGDLARKDVRFVNREPGSGSRALLDRLLGEAGVPWKRVEGYGRLASGHLAAAYAVMAGDGDCCVATRSAARAFGLDFIPLQSERYDFVMRRGTMELPSVRTFLDALQRASLRRTLESLAGYDTAQTGAVLA